ncbi:hypothetical protein E8E13_003823 [Curvularia kusanoi]|uniref:Uncharacterized protein n=1 Tax=Curvularia kusanoi TaxID=90978 RepID=A0A9P4WC06_CURKU|nr:hypothetical protein E8E13_003823 [Curvularia kusanoi]
MADHETSSSSPGSQRFTPDASSPSSFSAELTEALLDLAIDTEQSVAVSYFIQATKQPVSVAIETLEACQWDLVEAVSRFGEDVEQNQEELDELATPVIESMHPRSSSPSSTRRARRGSSLSSDLYHRDALSRATSRSRGDHPRSFRSLAEDPIALEHTPLTADATPPPMFNSPYSEKLWYTGFMKP